MEGHVAVSRSQADFTFPLSSAGQQIVVCDWTQRTFTDSRVQNEHLNYHGCDASVRFVHVDFRSSALITRILHNNVIGCLIG